MNKDTLQQEIEMKLREWKKEYEEYATLFHQAAKTKSLADNTGSQIASLMKRAKLAKLKTYYGTITIEDGILSVSGNPTHFVLEDAPTKKGRGRPKKTDTETSASV